MAARARARSRARFRGLNCLRVAHAALLVQPPPRLRSSETDADTAALGKWPTELCRCKHCSRRCPTIHLCDAAARFEYSQQCSTALPTAARHGVKGERCGWGYSNSRSFIWPLVRTHPKNTPHALFIGENEHEARRWAEGGDARGRSSGLVLRDCMAPKASTPKASRTSKPKAQERRCRERRRQRGHQLPAHLHRPQQSLQTTACTQSCQAGGLVWANLADEAQL